jgi:hypothetical protein
MMSSDKREENGDLWAIVEVMGHSVYAGRVSEHSGLGVPLIRVEIPETAKQPASEKLLGAASIFRITPCTEEAARKTAEAISVRPLSVVGFPVEPQRIAFGEADEDEDEEYEDNAPFDPGEPL